jgi:hypothetical protein
MSPVQCPDLGWQEQIRKLSQKRRLGGEFRPFAEARNRRTLK